MLGDKRGNQGGAISALDPLASQILRTRRLADAFHLGFRNRVVKQVGLDGFLPAGEDFLEQGAQQFPALRQVAQLHGRGLRAEFHQRSRCGLHDKARSPVAAEIIRTAMAVSDHNYRTAGRGVGRKCKILAYRTRFNMAGPPLHAGKCTIVLHIDPPSICGGKRIRLAAA